MRDRVASLLKLLCVVLAAVIVYEGSGVVLRRNPLAKVNIPAVPSLPDASAGGKSTNSASKSNNSGAITPAGKSGTNADGKMAPTNGQPDKLAAQVVANTAVAAAATTATNGGIVSTNQPGTNGLAAVVNIGGTNSAATNAPGTNSTKAVAQRNAKASGTNAPGLAGGKSDTNALAAGVGRRGGGASARGGKGGMPGGLPGVGPDTPPEVKARIERIYQSELFGPVNHPMPAALIGIAGDQVFLRAPNGQTGPVKVGGELGGLKVLKVGINRVLVEEDGEEKELTVFAGFGSESLMSQRKEKP